MRPIIHFTLVAAATLLPSSTYAADEIDLAKYVDPHIGTGGHGHVFLGASVPFGAVQVGPDNFFQGWDWCSGYHYSDNVIKGFSHLHLSGTGIPDLGDVLLMPYSGDIKTAAGTRDEVGSGYASRYSHENETARPGYYSVDLVDSGIKVELTATERVGFHRYRSTKAGPLHITLDLEHENGEGRAVKTEIRQIDAHTLTGYRFSTGWARDQRVYFAIKSEQPFESFKVFDGVEKLAENQGQGAAIKGVMTFVTGDDAIQLKVGISPVSEENALANIDAEAPEWDFDAIATEARQKWNDELQAIRIKTGDESQKKVFYTALYHTMIAPALFDDHNGDYRGTDNVNRNSEVSDNYSIFSLWDTYRAAHPLYTITQPERVDDFINSMLAIYEQQGKLPVWHLMGNETDTMIGYHAVPVIVDAYFKGVRGFDSKKAYEAIKASAMRDERGLKFVKERGFIPADREIESVAKALEYAIDDWCIAQMAQSLGRNEDYQYFLSRSNNYRQYFDPQIQFMRGKLADSSWRTPFDPVQSTHREDDYCEGNAWQYTWLVPHDVEGLIGLFGSEDAFLKKLDQLFAVDSNKTANSSMDISGLIGQYAHGNEPGHHTIYLYACAGQQWKTTEKVRQVLTTLYTDKPDGLAGNEDCGQMSAWYVFSSLGFYPVNPVGGRYVFGSPLFDETTLQLPDGKTFTVITNQNSAKNTYIQSMTLNGKPYELNYITHESIMKGGTLEITMGPTPNKKFGSHREHRLISGLPTKSNSTRIVTE
jgi:predicted alpha-1,2-mannosidase